MKNKIFFISCTDDYPSAASAINTKTGLLARGLSQQGDQVVIINKYYGNQSAEQKTGHMDGAAYLSLSQKNGKFLSSWINLFAICRILYRKKSSRCPNVVIIEAGSLVHHLILCGFSKLAGIRTGMIFQEWHLAFRIDFIHDFNNRLLDQYMGHCVDALFPISEFIFSKCRCFGKPLLKVPIVADFDMSVPAGEAKPDGNYFLYCASASYFRIIRFILDSFRLVMEKRDEAVRLKMVLSGDTGLVRDEIAKMGLENRVEIYSNVPYGELLQMYAGSSGLLIPLDPGSLQDIARFSQKIAEYLSSGRPILTTNVGEIPRYFEGGKNAYIAAQFTPQSYADLMQSVLDDPHQAGVMGKAGCELGRKEFDYRTITKQIHDFISRL